MNSKPNTSRRSEMEDELIIINRACPSGCVDNIRRQVAAEIFEELEKEFGPMTDFFDRDYWEEFKYEHLSRSHGQQE